MSKILIVDDQTEKMDNFVIELQSTGHDVSSVKATSVGHTFDEVRKILLDSEFDVVIFDIHFANSSSVRGDAWGGIWLHNKLVNSGLRLRWKETVIASRWASAHTQAITSGDDKDNVSSAFLLKVFADTANIPFDQVCPSFGFNGPAIKLALLRAEGKRNS